MSTKMINTDTPSDLKFQKPLSFPYLLYAIRNHTFEKEKINIIPFFL